MIKPYTYPSLEKAFQKPLITKDSVKLHEFKWGGKFWLQDTSFIFQRIAEKSTPFQHKNTMFFTNLLQQQANHIVDIGLNIGLMSYFYTKIANKVTAFEPTPKTIEMAAKNMVINNCHYNLTMYEAALSEEIGTATFIDFHNNDGINRITSDTAHDKRNTSTCFSITTLPLDYFQLENVDGIKIDTEGSEFFVIKGAKQTIEKFRPIVQVELIDENIKFLKDKQGLRYTSQDVYDWFSLRQYDAFTVKGKRLSERRLKERHMCDIFFVPKEKIKNIPCLCNDSFNDCTLFDY